MPIFRIQQDEITAVPETTFVEAGLKERADLQRLLKANISVLSPALMVIAEEFSQWADSSRRIDLLCIDKEACIVVVELKRTEDAGHSELQAIRYAAMVSQMTFRAVVDAYARFSAKAAQEAEADILAFLSWSSPQDDEFGKDVRVVLAAPDFSREITTTVMWLNARGLDIECVRLRPYRLHDGTLILDSQQIIPLPEAADFLMKVADKRDEVRRDRGERHMLRREFWTEVLSAARQLRGPHANRAPSDYGWIGGGGGGVALNYVCRQTVSRFEVYIDRGDVDANERTFSFFEGHRQEIEAQAGDLEWSRLPESRACRISRNIEGGYRSSKDDWPRIATELVKIGIQIESAFRPFIPLALSA